MGIPGNKRTVRPAQGQAEVNHWRDPREEKIAELRSEVERLKDQKRLLALEVNRIGEQILQERERADRMAIYEQQNASLREEIRRIQGNGEIPLKAARKA